MFKQYIECTLIIVMHCGMELNAFDNVHYVVFRHHYKLHSFGVILDTAMLMSVGMKEFLQFVITILICHLLILYYTAMSIM